MKRKIIPYNPALKELARQLRNNSTMSEIILWKQLRGKQMLGYDFHRQKPIDNYICDFYCPDLFLAIEIDGLTHQWSETEEKDKQKTAKLNELDVTVLRFKDEDVYKNIHWVLETICDCIKELENKYKPTPTPSKEGKTESKPTPSTSGKGKTEESGEKLIIDNDNAENNRQTL